MYYSTFEQIVKKMVIVLLQYQCRRIGYVRLSQDVSNLLYLNTYYTAGQLKKMCILFVCDIFCPEHYIIL